MTSHCNDFKLRPRNLPIALWALLLAACVGVIVYVLRMPPPVPGEVPRPPVPTLPAEAAQMARIEFFAAEVEPAIAEVAQANRDAAARCVGRLNETFDTYRRGIPPFVEEMTTWGTRWGVIWRMPRDWWNRDNSARDFITKKFEQHLFSEATLRSDLDAALAGFRQDVEANQILLLTQVRAALSSSDLPHLPTLDYGDFAAAVRASLEEFAARSAVRSVTNFVVVEIASGVAGYAVSQLLVAIATRIAAMAAASAASAGGATVTAAVAGGGGGSLAGPVGTGAGIVGGLLVGLIIDWWMTENFKQHLGNELRRMIDEIEDSVLRGTAEQMGLERALNEACGALDEAHRKSLRRRIVGEVL